MDDIGEVSNDTDNGDSLVTSKSRAPSTTERLTQLETSMQSIAESMAALNNAVGDLGRGHMPIAETPDAIIQAGGRNKAELRRRVEDLKNPRNQETGLQNNDVVSVIGGSELDQKMRSGLRISKEEDTPLGVIISYMFTKRDGARKYKVYFKGYGQDGCTEHDIALVRTY